MKRPIAELLTVSLQNEGQAAHIRIENEIWQILRRKQGYVTHRIYEQLDEPLGRLIYSEWESKKALDGARQQLQNTPLSRQVRATLSAAPQRTVVELLGPVTSIKGLHVPEGAVAATAICRPPENAKEWQDRQVELWRPLSEQAGHLAHVVFRGFDDPALAGSLSLWQDESTLDRVRSGIPGSEDGSTYLRYRPLKDARV